MFPFYTDDCLIEVTTWTGLTVYFFIKEVVNVNCISLYSRARLFDVFAACATLC